MNEIYSQIAGKGIGSIEARWLRKDGTIRHVIFFFTPLDPADLSAGVTFTVHDITDHKETESALATRTRWFLAGTGLFCIALIFLLVRMAASLKQRRAAAIKLHESNKRYNRLAEQSRTMTWETNVEGFYTHIGHVAEDLIGYSPDELVDKMHFYDLHPEDDREKFKTATFEVFHSRKSFVNLDNSLVHRDGHLVRVLTSGSPMLNPDGSLRGYRGSDTDITARKQAEEELRLNEQRLEALLELNHMTAVSESELTHFALEAIVRLTKSSIGYIAFVNEDESVLTMYAWSKEAMKLCAIENKPMTYSVCDTGLWGEAIRQRRAVITNDYAAPSTLKKMMPDGHIKIRRHMNAPIFDGDRIVMVAGVGNKTNDYGNDDVRQLTLLISGLWTILRHKRAEEEKEKLRLQLTQAQKMESVGRLAGGVAHDFNNMLGVIMGHSQLSLMTLDRENPLYGTLTEILKAAKRSASLTRQLLAFARRQTIQPKKLNLNETVTDILKMLQRLIGEDINMTLQLSGELWPVFIDPGQIDQILANLCVNARDAVSGTGKVTIETGNVLLDENYCAQNKGTVPGEYVMLAVSDNGCGMDEQTLSHIFEPFFTTKEIGKGTGLGLATVYGIVKQNNGYINVSSEPGLGTVFKIYLPRYAEMTAPDQGELGPQGLEPGSGTILLVEDEPMFLETTTRMLKNLGYTVLGTSSPGDAVNLIRECSGRVNLLIADVIMPGINGKELASTLKRDYPELKVLFMSGYTANVITGHGVLDKGVHLINKPFSITELSGRIREVFEA